MDFLLFYFFFAFRFLRSQMDEDDDEKPIPLRPLDIDRQYMRELVGCGIILKKDLATLGVRPTTLKSYHHYPDYLQRRKELNENKFNPVSDEMRESRQSVVDYYFNRQERFDYNTEEKTLKHSD